MSQFESGFLLLATVSSLRELPYRNDTGREDEGKQCHTQKA